MSGHDAAVTPSTEPVPADGLEGLRRHWRDDLTSGFLVFLIALPLCLGISMASGFPPVAGILTAIVGGLISTFLGSAPLTIKGPAAGLIVIALGAVTELGAGDPVSGYHKALAVGVVAALLQIGFSFVRVGTIAEMFPSSVLHGMLAAIGVIIFSKQMHTVLGVTPEGKEPLHLLSEVPHSLANLNPEVALIGLVSLAILFGLPRLPFAWAKKVPGPLVVLMFAIPMASVFDLGHEHQYHLGESLYVVGPKFLVSLPGNLMNAIARPDFSEITSAVSLKYIVMFSLVGTIESLLSAKAVDALDPWKRKSSMDKDMLAVGVGNLVAALIGGLPMISEIVRSSANINNGARTRFANFFHGAFLLLFVALLPGLIQRIPLAALAAMLVYTGLRLASPAEFRKTWNIGWEQLAVFTTTLLTTLATDLLVGVAVGIAVKLVLHLVHGAPVSALFRPQVDVESDEAVTVVHVRKAAVFSNYLGVRKALLAASATNGLVVVDLSDAAFIDHTVMEKLHELANDLAAEGRVLRVEGLESHRGLSDHPLSARRRHQAA